MVSLAKWLGAGPVARACHSEAVVSGETSLRGLRGVGLAIVPSAIVASVEAVRSGIEGQKPAPFGDTEGQAVLRIVEEGLGCVRHFGQEASACFEISEHLGQGPLLRAMEATLHRPLSGSNEPDPWLVVESSEWRVDPGSIADFATRLCRRRHGLTEQKSLAHYWFLIKGYVVEQGPCIDVVVFDAFGSTERLSFLKEEGKNSD